MVQPRIIFDNNTPPQLDYYNVTSNSSRYFDTCWMKDRSIDTSYVYSETESIIGGTLSTFVSIGGAILNFLVILVYLRSSNLRREYLTPSVVSIAITDLLFSAYPAPVMALGYFGRNMSLLSGCQVFAFSTYGLWSCSGLNHVGVAILRCVAVYFPRKTGDKPFQYACKLIPILGWIISILCLLPTLIGHYGQFDLEIRPTRQSDPEIIYWGLFLIFGALVLFLNVATYVQIRRHSKKVFLKIKGVNLDAGIKVLEKERKVGMAFGLISISFFIVYFPMNLVMILLALYPEASNSKTSFMVASQILASSFVVVDPMVYIMFRKKYLDELKEMMKPMFTMITPTNTKANKMRSEISEKPSPTSISF